MSITSDNNENRFASTQCCSLLYNYYGIHVSEPFTIPFDLFCTDYSVDLAIVMDFFVIFGVRSTCRLCTFIENYVIYINSRLSILYCYVSFSLLLKMEIVRKKSAHTKREKMYTIPSKYMQLFFYYFQESVRSR